MIKRFYAQKWKKKNMHGFYAIFDSDTLSINDLNITTLNLLNQGIQVNRINQKTIC